MYSIILLFCLTLHIVLGFNFLFNSDFSFNSTDSYKPETKSFVNNITVRNSAFWKLRWQRRSDSYRIVGGTVAQKGEFSFVVLLTDSNNVPFCGGSIINSDWIMTAAHCSMVHPPGEVKVIAGAYNISWGGGLDGTEQIRHVQRMVNHPQWSINESTGVDSGSDISLWSVNQPFVMSGTAAPVKFEFPTSFCSSVPSSTEVAVGVAMGWGAVAFRGKYPDTLEKVTLPLVDTDMCQSAFNPYKIRILSSMLCAGGEVGKDTCTSDSGGPLMCQQQCNGASYTYQCGIVSFSVDCATGGVPGVYTKVSNFTSFIISTAFQ